MKTNQLMEAFTYSKPVIALFIVWYMTVRQLCGTIAGWCERDKYLIVWMAEVMDESHISILGGVWKTV